jgi:Tol biopolymer transport system component
MKTKIVQKIVAPMLFVASFLLLLVAIGSVELADAQYPDVGKLAFRQVTPGAPANTSEIWMMNAMGSNPTRVTCNTRDDLASAWSPNGQMIAFYSQQVVGGLPSQFIYLINVNEGCGPGILLTEGRFPSWSPNGQKIAFDRGHLGVRDIYVRDLADGTEVQLTNDPAFPRNLRTDWSPDGMKIVFARALQAAENIEDIYVMNADGSDVTPLTFDHAGNNGPKWSPDGQRIVFQSNRNGNDEIYVMDADGTNQTRLTFFSIDGRDANQPDWSPDGQKIVFHCETPESIFQLCTMNADGTDVTQITNLPTSSAFPDWTWGHVQPPGP